MKIVDHAGCRPLERLTFSDVQMGQTFQYGLGGEIFLRSQGDNYIRMSDGTNFIYLGEDRDVYLLECELHILSRRSTK